MLHNHLFGQDTANQLPLYERIVVRMLDLMDVGEQQFALKEILSLLDLLNLKEIEKRERIYLIDSAIKFGSIEIVEKLTEKYIALGYEDDIRIPYEGHGEHPFRPVFWLAAIVTRLPNIPEENYQKIETYLCDKFQITNSVVINGTAITRNEYVQAVTEWKLSQNLQLRQRGRTDDRYLIENSNSNQRRFS